MESNYSSLSWSAIIVTANGLLRLLEIHKESMEYT